MMNIISIIGWEYFNYIIALIIVIIAAVSAKLVAFLIEKYLVSFAARTKSKIDDIIIGTIKNPIYIIFLLLGVYFSLNYLRFPWIGQIKLGITIIGVVLGTWVVYRIIPALMIEYGRYLAKKTETKIDVTVMPTLNRIIKIILLIVGFLIVLELLKVNITPMIAGLGIAGLAIALAAQETLSNMFSGFYLMIDRPFHLGDRILLESGELCEVREIGFRSTRLYNVIEHTLITMPNANLSKMKITNISAPDVKLRVPIPIGVAYGSDLRKVERILLEIARESPNVLSETSPQVIFQEFGDFSLNLTLYVWINDVKKKFDVLHFINTRIKERFEEEKIEIPFPIRTLYIKREE
jgi:MscS family membrane protein